MIMAGPASRRGFLAALTAFAGAGATGAALASPPALQADTDILAMGERLPGLVRQYEDAKEAKRIAKAAYQAACPVPPELVCERDDDLAFTARDERDWDNELIYSDYALGRCRKVLDADSLRFDLADYGPRTKLGKLIRRKLKVAEAHEKATAAAETSSGIRDAHRRLDEAEQALDALSVAIMTAPVSSLAGLAVKGRALMDHGQHLGTSEGKSWLTFVHAETIARDAVAVAEGVAS